jgi:iron complex outermembrane receptor protein
MNRIQQLIKLNLVTCFAMGFCLYEYKNALFSIYGHNLLDEDGFTIGFDVASLWSYAATRAPRTWGAQVVFSFGE